MQHSNDSITQISNEKVSQRASSKSQVTLRALILASILIPINGIWLIQMEEMRYSGHPTTASLFFNVIFWVLALITLNFGLKRILLRFAFSQGELVTIYAMLAISSAISGHDALIGLPPALGHTSWFATPENDWEALFIRYIPNWLSISDKSALHGYYRGESTLYTAETLKAWISPLAYWSIFYLVILFMMLCSLRSAVYFVNRYQRYFPSPVDATRTAELSDYPTSFRVDKRRRLESVLEE